VVWIGGEEAGDLMKSGFGMLRVGDGCGLGKAVLERR